MPSVGIFGFPLWGRRCANLFFFAHLPNRSGPTPQAPTTKLRYDITSLQEKRKKRGNFPKVDYPLLARFGKPCLMGNPCRRLSLYDVLCGNIIFAPVIPAQFSGVICANPPPHFRKRGKSLIVGSEQRRGSLMIMIYDGRANMSHKMGTAFKKKTRFRKIAETPTPRHQFCHPKEKLKKKGNEKKKNREPQAENRLRYPNRRDEPGL